MAICATDLEIMRHGLPAMVDGGLPFHKNFTIGHEYMGTVVRLGPAVDEYSIGDRVTVEVHAGCGRCARCRQGMYTACLNYGDLAKGHRANGFTTDGGFAQYAINNINTLVHVPRRYERRGGDPRRHRRHLDVRARCARRADRRRRRRRHRAGADRPARGRGRQGARRRPGDPDRHPRRAARISAKSSAPTM